MHLVINTAIETVNIVQDNRSHCRMIKSGVKDTFFSLGSAFNIDHRKMLVPLFKGIFSYPVKIPSPVFCFEVLFCPINAYGRDTYLDKHLLSFFSLKIHISLDICPFSSFLPLFDHIVNCNTVFLKWL